MKDKGTWGIIIPVAIVLLLIGFLIGGVITKSANTTEPSTTSNEMLVVIEDHALSAGYYIVYDKDTKIIYFLGVSHGKCLDPLYNPDGTFKLYNGGN